MERRLKQFRHGDVVLQEVTTLPDGLDKLAHTILAHGELTGHCHRIRESDQASLYQGQQRLFLQVCGPEVSLIHEEHAPIRLQAGTYQVWRQREYSPQEIRIVRD